MGQEHPPAFLTLGFGQDHKGHWAQCHLVLLAVPQKLNLHLIHSSGKFTLLENFLERRYRPLYHLPLILALLLGASHRSEFYKSHRTALPVFGGSHLAYPTPSSWGEPRPVSSHSCFQIAS